ncbi:MAG: serine hydrolase domain-containing protein [Mobilitalea sp.]
MKKRITKVIKLIIVTMLAISVILVVFLMIQRSKPLNQAYVEEVIADTRKIFDIQAISIQVMDSDEIRYTAIDGVRVDGTEAYVTEEDYFHIGSCSKSILSLIAAKQVEGKMIQWDTPFFDVFPELEEVANVTYSNITLEDLLGCRAGIQPYTSGTEMYPDEVLNAQNPNMEFLEYLVTTTPSSEKNENDKFEFLYSNASYAMANAMLEKATGKTYDELIDIYLHQDLEIDAWNGWPYENDENQPFGHIEVEKGELQIVGPDTQYSLNALIAPAGDLSMSPDDFTRYIQLHLRGLVGKSEYLSQDTFEYIDLGDEAQSTKEGEYFALGTFAGSMLGKDYIYFDGTAGTFYARGMIVPKSNFGFTIMVNNGNVEAIEYITMRLTKAKYNWWWMFWI